MHQTAKKVLAFLLTLCLILGVLPVGAQAALVEGEDYITQSMSLGSDLILHLWGSLPAGYEKYESSATGTLTYAGQSGTKYLSELEKNEKGFYHLPVELAVAQMTENVNLTMNYGAIEIINEDYTIQNYLMTLLEGDYSQMTKDLCLELLNMGSRAQEYFGYNTDNLADAGNTITPANTVPAESPVVKVTGSMDGITFYGTSVRFLSQTAVRFYFKTDAVDGYTFTIDGTQYEPVAKDGMYYIETPGINPQNMSDEIAVKVTDGTNTISVGYAPIWYFIRSYNKADNETTKGLMAAAYSYYKEAETYTTQICMDVEITTLGNSTEEIELGFFPSDFEGDINNYTDKVTVTAGTTTTVKLDQGKYLVDGELSGIGFAVFGGPTWDAVLEDGTTADRHTIKISNMRLEGAGERTVDMSNATVAEGQTGTGYTNANDFGTASVVDGTIVITEGVCYDAYKITLNEIRTYLSLDMLITTLGNSTDPIDVGFYPHNFEGDINNMIDRVTVTAGTTSTVKLDMEKYLVDGEIPGIGFAIFGGPAWDAKLEDGYTPDRHTITISNMRLEGEWEKTFELSTAAVTSGADAGYTTGQGNGVASRVDGTVVITDGFCYDAHKITLNAIEEPEVTEPEVTEPEVTEPEVTEPEVTEPEETEPPVEEADTYICLDMLITTLSNSTEAIEVGFFPNNFEGDINNYTDKIAVTAGSATTVKLNLDKYLVDGVLPGIGFAVFGGPEWDAKLEDGYTPDRHTITISDVYLEGEQSAVYDLSKSVWTSAANAGYTNANGSGVAEIGSSLVITGGYRYDGHKITLSEDSCTDIYLDVLITTLGNSTDAIDVGFFPNNFEGDINNYTDKIAVTAGEQATIKLDLDDYLVDGELPGIGFAIFGGPTWDAKLEDGYTPDRHTITISGVRLEGAQSKLYDLSKSEWTSAANAGYSNANGSGVAEIGSSIVITGGFCYDGHKITLVEDTNTYICLDMLITTLGNSTDAIDVGFYPHSFEGDINNYTDKIAVTAGTTTTVRLKQDNYLVDGELPGIGFAIFGGPAWDAKLEDGYTPDRHTITISGMRLEGPEKQTIELSTAAVASGQNGTGYTNANGSGQATVGDTIVITGGFQYDGHKITLNARTVICVDMLIDTLGGNWTDDIEIGFFPSNFEGDINNCTDKIAVKAGEQTTIKLDLEKYLVDGKFSGLGFAIFGGPAWDAKLEDGYTPDRTTITVSGVRLIGAQSQTYDLSNVTWTRGSEAGYTNGNLNGVVTIADGIVVITDGFRYDAHKFTFNT